MKRLIRSLVVIMLVISMTSSFCSNISVNAAKIKLNKTHLTIYVGQTYQLKLKNAKASKVKWYVDAINKSFCTVSKKGLVTAKKSNQGDEQIYIVAKYKGYRYECLVDVIDKYIFTNLSNTSLNYTNNVGYKFNFNIYNRIKEIYQTIGSGKITVKITNNNKNTVYNKTLTISKNNFNGYKCSVLVPIKDIAKLSAGRTTKDSFTNGKISIKIFALDKSNKTYSYTTNITNLPFNYLPDYDGVESCIKLQGQVYKGETKCICNNSSFDASYTPKNTWISEIRYCYPASGEAEGNFLLEYFKKGTDSTGEFVTMRIYKSKDTPSLTYSYMYFSSPIYSYMGSISSSKKDIYSKTWNYQVSYSGTGHDESSLYNTQASAKTNEALAAWNSLLEKYGFSLKDLGLTSY